jgi:hypothetical protein
MLPDKTAKCRSNPPEINPDVWHKKNCGKESSKYHRTPEELRRA